MLAWRSKPSNLGLLITSNCDPVLCPRHPDAYRRPLWSHKQYPWCLHVRSVFSPHLQSSEEPSPSVLPPLKTTQPSTLSVDCTKDVNWWCHDLNPSLFRDWMETSAHPSANAPALQSCLCFVFLFIDFFPPFPVGWGSWECLPTQGFLNPPRSPFSSVAPACEDPPRTETLHVPTLKLHLAWQTFKGL